MSAIDDRPHRAYEKNDIPELKLEYFVMLKNRENAWSDYLQSYYYSKKRKSFPKLQEWAIEAARLLVEDIEGKGFTENQAWEHMPDGTTFEEFEWNDYQCEVYRDDEKLCCVATIESQNKNADTLTAAPDKKSIIVKKENLGELKKSTFLKIYYRPAKNSGT